MATRYRNQTGKYRQLNIYYAVTHNIKFNKIELWN